MEGRALLIWNTCGTAEFLTRYTVALSIRKARGVVIMKDTSHDDAMATYFRANPEYAIELLAELRLNGSLWEQLILLRQMRKAFGHDLITHRAGSLSS